MYSNTVTCLSRLIQHYCGALDVICVDLGGRGAALLVDCELVASGTSDRNVLSAMVLPGESTAAWAKTSADSTERRGDAGRCSIEAGSFSSFFIKSSILEFCVVKEATVVLSLCMRGSLAAVTLYLLSRPAGR